MRLIDCHTHAGIDYFWSKTDIVPYKQTVEELADTLVKNDILGAIVFPMASSPYYSYESMIQGFPKPSGSEAFPYESSNKSLLSSSAEVEGVSLYPLACISPADKIDEQMKFIDSVKTRLYGFKYHPYACQASLADERNAPFLDYANSMNWSMVVHYGLDEFSNSKGLIELASRYPNINFSFAHIARFDLEILDNLNYLPNIFIDVACLSGECEMAGSFSLTSVYPGYRKKAMDYDDPGSVLQNLLSEYPGKVLWGTDQPFTKLHDSKKRYYTSDYASEVELAKPFANSMFLNAIRFLRLDETSLPKEE